MESIIQGDILPRICPTQFLSEGMYMYLLANHWCGGSEICKISCATFSSLTCMHPNWCKIKVYTEIQVFRIDHLYTECLMPMWPDFNSWTKYYLGMFYHIGQLVVLAVVKWRKCKNISWKLVFWLMVFRDQSTGDVVLQALHEQSPKHSLKIVATLQSLDAWSTSDQFSKACSSVPSWDKFASAPVLVRGETTGCFCFEQK